MYTMYVPIRSIRYIRSEYALVVYSCIIYISMYPDTLTRIPGYPDTLQRSTISLPHIYSLLRSSEKQVATSETETPLARNSHRTATLLTTSHASNHFWTPPGTTTPAFWM